MFVRLRKTSASCVVGAQVHARYTTAMLTFVPRSFILDTSVGLRPDTWPILRVPIANTFVICVTLLLSRPRPARPTTATSGTHLLYSGVCIHQTQEPGSGCVGLRVTLCPTSHSGTHGLTSHSAYSCRRHLPASRTLCNLRCDLFLL
jgi:hypothetical protein